MEKNKLDMQELLSKGNYTRDDYLNTVKTINDAKEKIAFAKANLSMPPRTMKPISRNPSNIHQMTRSVA